MKPAGRRPQHAHDRGDPHTAGHEDVFGSGMVIDAEDSIRSIQVSTGPRLDLVNLAPQVCHFQLVQISGYITKDEAPLCLN